MKKKQIAFLFICLPLFALATFAQTPQMVKRTITKTDSFEFGAGGTVAVTGAPNGSIRIVGTNKNEIEITAEIELQAANEADLAKLAAVTGFGTDEMTARTGIISYGTYNKLGDKKLWKKFPKNLMSLPMRIDYVIKVPHYCDLEIDGGKGDLWVSDVQGSMRINFLETNADIDVIGGATNVTVGSGKVNMAFGLKGWRGRSADINVAKGDLNIKLPTTMSAEIDATILRTGAIENTFPDLKPRNRKVAFTDKSIVAKAGAGGAPLKFTVGDGKLKMEPLVLPL
jgi:hypothetical protein